MTDKSVPSLPSADLERTRKFYRYFGFEPVGGPDETWLRLARGAVELDFHLTSLDYTHPDHVRYQNVCVIRVADVAAWYDSFARTRMRWKMLFPSLTRPRDDLWNGLPAFCLTDRDGNLIRCVESEKGTEA